MHLCSSGSRTNKRLRNFWPRACYLRRAFVPTLPALSAYQEKLWLWLRERVCRCKALKLLAIGFRRGMKRCFVMAVMNTLNPPSKFQLAIRLATDFQQQLEAEAHAQLTLRLMWLAGNPEEWHHPLLLSPPSLVVYCYCHQ